MKARPPAGVLSPSQHASPEHLPGPNADTCRCVSCLQELSIEGTRSRPRLSLVVKWGAPGSPTEESSCTPVPVGLSAASRPRCSGAVLPPTATASATLGVSARPGQGRLGQDCVCPRGGEPVGCGTGLRPALGRGTCLPQHAAARPIADASGVIVRHITHRSNQPLELKGKVRLRDRK